MRAATRAADLALPHLKPGRTRAVSRCCPTARTPTISCKSRTAAPFDKVMAEARAAGRDALACARHGGHGFDTPETRAELEARLKQLVAGDRRRERAPPLPAGHARPAEHLLPAAVPEPRRRPAGATSVAAAIFRRRQFRRGQFPWAKERGGKAGGPRARAFASDRLTRSGLVRGHQENAALRECVLALTVVNHPR